MALVAAPVAIPGRWSCITLAGDNYMMPYFSCSLCRHFSKYFQVDPTTKLPPGFTRAGNRFSTFLSIQLSTICGYRAVCIKCTESSLKPVYVQSEESAVRWETFKKIWIWLKLIWSVLNDSIRTAQRSLGCETWQPWGGSATGGRCDWSTSG